MTATTQPKQTETSGDPQTGEHPNPTAGQIEPMASALVLSESELFARKKDCFEASTKLFNSLPKSNDPLVSVSLVRQCYSVTLRTCIAHIGTFHHAQAFGLEEALYDALTGELLLSYKLGELPLGGAYVSTRMEQAFPQRREYLSQSIPGAIESTFSDCVK